MHINKAINTIKAPSSQKEHKKKRGEGETVVLFVSFWANSAARFSAEYLKARRFSEREIKILSEQVELLLLPPPSVPRL